MTKNRATCATTAATTANRARRLSISPEPVLRSLAYALLQHDGANPATSDERADRPWRANVERASSAPRVDGLAVRVARQLEAHGLLERVVHQLAVRVPDIDCASTGKGEEIGAGIRTRQFDHLSRVVGVGHADDQIIFSIIVNITNLNGLR